MMIQPVEQLNPVYQLPNITGTLEVKRRRVRPVFDEYIGELVGDAYYISKIEGILENRNGFYQVREANSGEYCLFQTSPRANVASGDEAPPSLPPNQAQFDLSRRADARFGSLLLARSVSLEIGLALMDYFVEHDLRMRRALKRFQQDPEQVLNLVEAAWTAILKTR